MFTGTWKVIQRFVVNTTSTRHFILSMFSSCQPKIKWPHHVKFTTWNFADATIFAEPCMIAREELLQWPIRSPYANEEKTGGTRQSRKRDKIWKPHLLRWFVSDLLFSVIWLVVLPFGMVLSLTYSFSLVSNGLSLIFFDQVVWILVFSCPKIIVMLLRCFGVNRIGFQSL